MTFRLTTILVLLTWPLSAAAQADSSAAPSAGGVPSYWGTIPPPGDSVTAEPHNNRMPVWEGIVEWPYRVATFPLKLLGLGLAETASFFGENPATNGVRRLFRPTKGPLFLLPNIRAGGGAGFGGGLGFRHIAFFGEGNELRGSFSITNRKDYKATLGMHFPVGPRGALEIGAGYRQRPNARFYGLGSASLPGNLSYFTQTAEWAGASYRHLLGGSFYLQAEGLYSRVDAAPTTEVSPPLETVFSGNLPPGFGVRSRGFDAGLSLGSDDTHGTARPRRGGIRRAYASRFFSGQSGEASYWHYRAEIQQFLPLWFRGNSLALRGFASWIDPSGNNPVVFQRLMTNDDPDLLRGFRDFRWRDRGLLVLSAEYRWPILGVYAPDDAGVDAYLLADVGQVFGNAKEITGPNLTKSYGGGLRLFGKSGLVGRIEYARSSEGGVLRIRGDQVFQFAKGGLLYGHSPIPSR